MAPLERIEALNLKNLNKKDPKKAAVLALFYPNQISETYLLLILRKTYVGVHSNQIGFPGGKMEKGDRSLLDTALRETEEEVGVKPGQVEIIRSLTELYIPPSNFEVLPYIGLYDKQQPFVIQESEVASLVEVPLYDFMDDEKLTSSRFNTSYARNIEVPAFNLNGFIVWGATAMMLSEIKELFKKVF